MLQEPTAKFEDLSWIPRTYRTEDEDSFLQAVFLPQQARSALTRVHAHAHTQITKDKMKPHVVIRV